MTIVANDIRTKGVQVIKEALDQDDEAVISVRGKPEYVVISAEKYEKLKEYELDIAYLEAMKDIQNGNYKVQNAEEHIKALKDVLRDN